MEDLSSKLISIDPDFLLDKFASMTKEKYNKINSDLEKGLIEDIRIKNPNIENSKWNLSYKKLADSVSNPFFGKLLMIGISDVLKYANDKINFTDEFVSILPKYSKNKEIDEPSLFACITARATGDDIDKMKDISDIAESELKFNMENQLNLFY